MGAEQRPQIKIMAHKYIRCTAWTFRPQILDAWIVMNLAMRSNYNRIDLMKVKRSYICYPHS